MSIGRPRGPTKLHLTPDVSAEIARRVQIRLDASKHSNKSIARDYGVTEIVIVSAISRLRAKGYL